MAKNAQERYEALRDRLKEIGQHGILWQLDLTVQALRAEHLQAQVDAVAHAVLREVQSVKPYVEPAPGVPGEGGGASSAAGVDDKAPLPDGAIA